MNANYPDAEVFYPSNPVGIDAKIITIQTAFAAKLPWLQKIFGRCTGQKKFVKIAETGRYREIDYPEVYQANDEPMSAMPNDNFNSYCFFNVTDPSTFLDYNPFDNQQLIQRPVSIIFWCNLAKLNPSWTGRYNENLIIDVIKALSNIPDFIMNKSYEQYENAFQNFTILDEYREYMKLPFTAFRIDGLLTYAAFPENVC